jgi:PAS domain S-box-containing protein
MIDHPADALIAKKPVSLFEVGESRSLELDVIFKYVPVGLVILDRNFTFLRVNAAVAETNGVPLDQHVGRTVPDVLPGFPDSTLDLFRRVFDTGIPIVDVEVRGTTPREPGVERVWLDSIYPIRDTMGEISCILVVVDEITTLVRAREESAIAKSRLELALRTRNIATYDHGETWDDIVWSDAAYDLWGVPRRPGPFPLAEALRKVAPEDLDRLSEARDAAVAGDVIKPVIFPITNADGHRRWLSGVGQLFQTLGGPRVIGVYEDVTEQKEQELSLKQALEQKNILLHEVEHRIKNSLQLVMGLLNLQATASKDGDVRAALQAAANRVATIARLHERLYQLEDLSEVDLGACVRDIVQAVADQAQAQADVVLAFDIDALVVSGDVAFPVGMIVNELITNAFKYGFPRGRTGTIKVSVKRRGEEVEVTVADDGVGIPGEIKPGLGTRVVRSLAAQLQGTLLRVEGPGYTKRLTFPLAATS